MNRRLEDWLIIVLASVLAILFWYVSIPIITAAVIIWFIWRKSQIDKKKKIIATLITVGIGSLIIDFYLHINRPSVTIIEPENDFSIQSDKVLIKGIVDSPFIKGIVDSKSVDININEAPVRVENGTFNHEVKLLDEKNRFIVEISNGKKKTQQQITINRIFTEAEELARQREWEKSKAAPICEAHPEWTRSECKRIADNEIWIGMTLDMLKYNRGAPDSVNPVIFSGFTTEWQWCWHDYTPSCFYSGAYNGIIWDWE